MTKTSTLVRFHQNVRPRIQHCIRRSRLTARLTCPWKYLDVQYLVQRQEANWFVDRNSFTKTWTLVPFHQNVRPRIDACPERVTLTEQKTAPKPLDTIRLTVDDKKNVMQFVRSKNDWFCLIMCNNFPLDHRRNLRTTIN